ncbi:MAG: hypothetical protein V4560_00325 [Bacteroidota bacterium]
MNASKIKLFFYIGIFLYTSIVIALFCFSKQYLVWDSGITLKMTDNGVKNIPFNHYQHPKVTNLNEDETEFVTWWTPGQFAMPQLVQKIIPVSLYSTIKILTILCLLISGFGIFKLYHRLIDYKENIIQPVSITTLAIFAFTLIQPFFWANIFLYYGGGILMLAYCPWFIYWTIKLNNINFYNLLLLLILGFVGFFLKASFTSIFIGSLLYCFLLNSELFNGSLKNLNYKKIIRNGLYLGLIFVIYIVIGKTYFLNYNRNISDTSMGIGLNPRAVAFPLIAPIFGIFFSLNTIIKTISCLIGSVLVIAIYYFILRSKQVSSLYKNTLVSFVGINFVFYSLIYLSKADVSYEFRHFTILTILVIPAFFLIWKRSKVVKFSFVGLMILYSLFNAYNFTKTDMITTKYNSVGYYSKLPLPYPPGLINKIHTLDNLKNNGRDIFCFSDSYPIIALEIKNNRVLLQDNYLNFHFDYSKIPKHPLYYGYNSGNIYAICPVDSLSNLTKFEKYKKFEKIYQTDGYGIFKAIAPNK